MSTRLLGLEQAWLTERWSAFFVIIVTEIWKTTPFMALLLLAGLTLVPEDLLRAARVDGASATQRFFKITLPLMKPAVLVALLFRTLDAFRIFDTVFVQTRGAQDTETVSVVGYNTLVVRLNLGLGSAVSVLIFLSVVLIAVLFVKAFGTSLDQEQGESPMNAERSAMERVFWGFGGVVVVIYALVPVAWILSLSLKPSADLNDNRFFPRAVSFEHYRTIFQDIQFPAALWNSVGIATLSTLLAVTLGNVRRLCHRPARVPRPAVGAWRSVCRSRYSHPSPSLGPCSTYGVPWVCSIRGRDSFCPT